MKEIRSALKPIVREALSQGGAALGGLSGSSGAIFGKAMGQKLSKIIGSGDYQTNTSVNALITPPGGPASASFGDDGQTIRIRKREFLADVLAPSEAGRFTNYAYSINAGSRETFPFLSQMAANYEEYCFDGLVFEFISSASPYIANSALGTVIASMQYNAEAPDFATKYTMENSSAAISTRLDKNLMYGVECAKGANAQNCYYIRTGTSTLPLTTTDLGKFELAIAPSAEVPLNAVLGELWVTYDVCLKRPVLEPSRYGFYHQVRSGVSPANPFGTTTVSLANGGIGYWRMVSNNTITFSDAVVGDQWLFVWSVVGTVNAAGVPAVPGITATGGVLAKNFLISSAGADTASFVGGGRSGAAYVTGVMTLAYHSTIELTQKDGVLTFDTSGANWPTGTVYMEVMLISLGNALTATTF